MTNKPLRTPPAAGGSYELPPAGVYLARCIKMIDIGTQTNESPKYGVKKQREIILYWELLTDDDTGEAVFMEDGKSVFVISNKYTWSMHTKANLRKTLDSWRGVPFTDEEAKDFEISKLLGKYCKLQVVHNVSGDRTFANVGSIMTTTKEPAGVNKLVTFSIEDPDMEVYESLPEWLKDKINSAPEFDGDFDESGIEIEEDTTINDKGELVGVSEEEIKKTQF